MPKLDWLTRSEDEKVSAHVPYRLLEAVAEHSYGDPGSENMLIQGDNLDALKALLPFYAGRVKCIFIDPNAPYPGESMDEHVPLATNQSGRDCDCRFALAVIASAGDEERGEVNSAAKRHLSVSA